MASRCGSPPEIEIKQTVYDLNSFFNTKIDNFESSFTKFFTIPLVLDNYDLFRTTMGRFGRVVIQNQEFKLPDNFLQFTNIKKIKKISDVEKKDNTPYYLRNSKIVTDCYTITTDTVEVHESINIDIVMFHEKVKHQFKCKLCEYHLIEFFYKFLASENKKGIYRMKINPNQAYKMSDFQNCILIDLFIDTEYLINNIQDRSINHDIDPLFQMILPMRSCMRIYKYSKSNYNFNIELANSQESNHRYNQIDFSKYFQPILTLKPSINDIVSQLDIENNLNATLFNHQRKNVLWMKNLEKHIENKDDLTFLNYKTLSHHNVIEIQNILYYFKKEFSNVSKLTIRENCHEHNNKKVNIIGGVLADEVGLGKTLTMLSLIISNPISDSEAETILSNYKNTNTQRKSKATIIFCPSRLVQQWKLECETHYKNKFLLNIQILSTISHLKKMNLKYLFNSDIIIISTNLIFNKNYKEYISDNPNFDLSTIHWYRIIVDEAHEFINNWHRTSTNQRKFYIECLKFTSRFKWAVTGTPFAYSANGIEGILQFLTNRKHENVESVDDLILYNLTPEEYNYVIQNFFRFNSKESIENDVTIPPIHFVTKFLKQTPTENTLYNTAKNQNNYKKMLQICTNILISDSNLLGNDFISMDKINDIMIAHYNSLIETNQKLISDSKKRLETSTANYNTDRDRLTQSRTDLENQYYNITSTREVNSRYYEIETIEYDLRLLNSRFQNKKNSIRNKINNCEKEIELSQRQIKCFTTHNNYIREKAEEPCCICLEEINEIAIGQCGHLICRNCITQLFESSYNPRIAKCPQCRYELDKDQIKYTMKLQNTDENDHSELVNKYGTKMAFLIEYLNILLQNNTSTDSDMESENYHRVIIFSQWKEMLNLVGSVLEEYNIKHVFCRGNVHVISKAIRLFKTDKSFRVIMLSSETCSSGSNLTEASHIVLLDTVNYDKVKSNAIEEQAIGRAARLGQKKKVQIIRMIMKDTIEYDYYNTNTDKTNVVEIDPEQSITIEDITD